MCVQYVENVLFCRVHFTSTFESLWQSADVTHCTLWFFECFVVFFSRLLRLVFGSVRIGSTVWPHQVCEECVYASLKLLFIVIVENSCKRRNVSRIYIQRCWAIKPLSLFCVHTKTHFHKKIIDLRNIEWPFIQQKHHHINRCCVSPWYHGTRITKTANSIVDKTILFHFDLQL